jgi:hypothetical protein
MDSVKPRRWYTQLFSKPAEEPTVSPFHAVSIRCGSNACQVAKDKLDERHLSADTPMLPLKQCDRPDQCDCRYQHYDDRRDDLRRISEQGLRAQTDFSRDDRRSAKDRRAPDDTDGTGSFSVHDGSYYEHAGQSARSALVEAGEADEFDPYNSGRFNESKASDSGSDK